MIDFHLEVIDRDLIFFIRGMDKDQINKDKNDEKSFKTSNNICVFSSENVELRVIHEIVVCIFLLGCNSGSRLEVFTHRFKHKANALTEKRRILDALTEWVKRGGFIEEPASSNLSVDQNDFVL